MICTLAGKANEWHLVFSLGDSDSAPVLRFLFKFRIEFPLQERASGSGGHTSYFTYVKG
jgi:hypothetical protein